MNDYINYKWRKFINTPQELNKPLGKKTNPGRQLLLEGDERLSAARAGSKYEHGILQTIDNALLTYWESPEAAKAGHYFVEYESRAAGHGAGSDVEIFCQGKKIFSLETKTQQGAEFGQTAVRFNVATWEWELSAANPTPMEEAMAEAAFGNPEWAANIVTFEPWELWYYQDVINWSGTPVQLQRLKIPTTARTEFAEKALSRLAPEDRGKTIRKNDKNAECLTLPGSYVTGLKAGTSKYCKLPCPDTITQVSKARICTMREELKFELEQFWGLTKTDGEGWSGITSIPWDYIKDKYKEKGDMFIQVGKGKGLYALDNSYQWSVGGSTIPLWQDETPTATVRFRLKRQGGTLKPLTIKFALGLSGLSASSVDLDDPFSPAFKGFIIKLADEIKKACGGSELEEHKNSLTNTPIRDKMSIEMVRNLMDKK